jgi:hypothetical protein
MKTTTGRQVEAPKFVFRRMTAFQPDAARAAAEDAADNAWRDEADRISCRMYSELEGSDPFERMMALMAAKLPPKPPGFHDRRNRCNRCGLASEYSMESDASFCRTCNRWLEDKCRDPGCRFCSRRQEKPLP